MVNVSSEPASAAGIPDGWAEAELVLTNAEPEPRARLGPWEARVYRR